MANSTHRPGPPGKGQMTRDPERGSSPPRPMAPLTTLAVGGAGSSLPGLVRRSWTLLDFILIWLAGAVVSALAAEAARSLELPDDLRLLVTLAGQFVGILLMFAILYVRRRADGPITFGLATGDARFVLLGIGFQIAANILMQPIARMVYPEDAGPPQMIAEIIGRSSTHGAVRIAFFASAALLAPLTEELLYRGVLFQATRRWGAWVAIITTSVVFTAVHLLGLDPENFAGSAAIVLPPLFVLAILLGWLTERTGRLGPAFFVHSGFNLLAALILLIPPELLQLPT